MPISNYPYTYPCICHIKIGRDHVALLKSQAGEHIEAWQLKQFTVDSKYLEHGWRMINDGFPSFFGLGLEDGHIPTFWLLL